MTKVYFDENFPENLFLGLKHLNLSYHESKDFEFNYIPKEFYKSCPDEEWIPTVGENFGIVFTYDFNINKTRQLYQLSQETKTSFVFLRPTIKGAMNYWETIKILIKHWEEIIKQFKRLEKPFTLRITINKVEILR